MVDDEGTWLRRDGNYHEFEVMKTSKKNTRDLVDGILV